jgi:ABC-2 type transport system ATP-binding protein
VNGLDAVEQSLEIRRIIGYLPESNPLYGEMYVREYLKYITGIYGMSKNSGSLVEEIVERTGLIPEAHKKIKSLSKGYRQRVAQALVHNPGILVLDEPTSGLDPNQIVEIRNLISQLGTEKTVMLSTHILQEVEAICDRVIIIDRGKIVADESMNQTSGKELEKKFRDLTSQ